MVWDKKTSFCIQNIFFDEKAKFYYARMLLDDISDSAFVFPILREMDATIRYGTFSRIEDNKTKWAFTFSTPEKIDIRAFIEKLAATKVRLVPATTWENDIVYLADGCGYCPEYPIIGYPDIDPQNVHTMTLTGGLWRRIMAAMDRTFGSDGADIVMYLAGKEQGIHVATKYQIAEKFKISKNVTDPNFIPAIQNLFRAYGYCDIERIGRDEKSNKVKDIWVHHSAFNIKNFKADEERKCDFQRGFFDGFFSTYLGTDHTFEEIECMGEGKDKCVYLNES
jgi:predicted hydrocarbon binding protein